MFKVNKLRPKPLVSIITPSYNSGLFIEECVQSILVQDYPNIEHIIQDGASTDNSVKILKKYSSPKYRDKIRWISKKDNGPVDAYNQALLRSRGEIILFLGADDILIPSAVSLGVGNMAKFPEAAVIYGDEYIIDEKSRILKTFTPRSYSFTKLLCLELVIPTEASFIRRSVFEKVGFHLDKSLKNAPDYELWLRIGSKFPMRHVGGFVTRYRWHTQSQSRSPNLLNNFVREKKRVMDRFFLSSSSPKRIKSLKRRAYIGLYFWAATMQISYGAKYRAVKNLARALLFDPSKERFKEYVSFWKQAVKDYEHLKNQK
ncbi:MAG: glycosyltransferase family 2 protein [Patescibacteria group bacterium]